MALIKLASTFFTSRAGRILSVLVLALLFGAVWYKNISGSLIHFDAGENLQLALNLEHNHIYSADQDAPYHPSNVREPVPVFSIALAVAVVDAIKGKADSLSYFQGERARDVKLQNLVWMALLCVAVFYAIYTLCSSFYLGLLGVVLINKVPLVASGLVYWNLLIDSLYTEIPAATLLLLGSTLAVQGIKRPRMSVMAGAGLCFGALALTKAAVLYIFLGVAAIWLVVALVRGSRDFAWFNARQVLLMSGCFLLVVVPWLVRNHAQVGTFQIAGRGGFALYQRSINNELNNDEVRSTLYWWAPDPVTRWVFGRALGLTPDDFIHRDSRMRRLSRDEPSDFYDDDFAAMWGGHPERAISLYFMSFADKQQILYKLQDQQVENADILTDRIVQQKSIELIRDHPWRQLIMTPLFIYRAAPYVFLALAAGFFYSLRTRRPDLVAMIMPSLAIMAFYALLTDYITRYAVLVMPLTVAVVIATANAMYLRARKSAG
jgi:hypothetical protein